LVGTLTPLPVLLICSTSVSVCDTLSLNILGKQKMENSQQQVVDRIKQANNILVTVKSNPTVDHLAACIGLTIALNKMGKHATAVFSGDIPSTIEFLQPEKTIEKNTDSLRDFIIALDKSKADKLRYKVEDRVVKIFITPYRTSISDKDLEFSQGDFNVDVVLALGVHEQADLDQAITAHGRILHDATVMSVNVAAGPALGSINWTEPLASSLSELAVVLLDGLDKKLLDGQIATALLTGIVAETARFSNEKTSPRTMSISAELMAVGANQQLVATKLEEPAPMPQQAPAEQTEPSTEVPEQQKADGSLEIDHTHDQSAESAKPVAEPDSEPEEVPAPKSPQIHIDDQGDLELPARALKSDEPKDGSHMILQPPTLGGQLTANANPEELEPTTDPLSLPSVEQPILHRDPIGVNTGNPISEAQHDASTAAQPAETQEPKMAVETSNEKPAGMSSTPAEENTNKDDETLSQIEHELNSPHLHEESSEPASTSPATTPKEEQNVDNARDAVADAIKSDSKQQLDRPASFNAQPLGEVAHEDAGPTVIEPTIANAVSPSGAPTSTTPDVTYNPLGGNGASTQTPTNPAPFAPPGLTLPSTEPTPTSVAPTPPTNEPEELADPNKPPQAPPPFMPPMPNA
jgi:hypothetical protein